MIEAGPILLRGKHILPLQSQTIRRDLAAEEIARNLSGKCHAYRLTAQQIQDRRDRKPGTGLPYEFLVFTPESPATSWTAFFTSWDFRDWMEAYGITVGGSYPPPGGSFTLRLPTSEKAFKPLCEAIPVNGTE